MYDSTIDGRSRAVDLRDEETAGHSRRVTATTLRVARVTSLADVQARTGGDEFAILLPATDAHRGRSRAERLRITSRETLRPRVGVTASIVPQHRSRSPARNPQPCDAVVLTRLSGHGIFLADEPARRRSSLTAHPVSPPHALREEALGPSSCALAEPSPPARSR